MQNPKFKLCPYCNSAQSLDSRYCSQCANALDESTYASGFSKHKNTILITAFGTACVLLLTVIAAFMAIKPASQTTAAPANTNKQISTFVSASPANSNTNSATNSEAVKATPKKTATPTASPEIAAEPVLPSVEKTESKRTPAAAPDDGDRAASSKYITGSRGGCYYCNSSGNKTYVDHSFCGRENEPAYSTPRPAYQAPAETTSSSGASAKCRDGSLSYSASRRGTCSHHGGVAVWY